MILVSTLHIIKASESGWAVSTGVSQAEFVGGILTVEFNSFSPSRLAISAERSFDMQETRTANRGFASMDAVKQREIARKGGKAAHVKGTAHEFTRDEARAAGRKGGERVSTNREHMSRIGRIGGKSSAGKRQTTQSSDLPGHTAPDRTAKNMNPENAGAAHAAEEVAV
jgi:uncharacterized protein